jgi:hypothetical protein
VIAIARERLRERAVIAVRGRRGEHARVRGRGKGARGDDRGRRADERLKLPVSIHG